jgi:hypothetical protein
MGVGELFLSTEKSTPAEQRNTLPSWSKKTSFLGSAKNFRYQHLVFSKIRNYSFQRNPGILRSFLPVHNPRIFYRDKNFSKSIPPVAEISQRFDLYGVQVNIL